jgi:hypothetical protein
VTPEQEAAIQKIAKTIEDTLKKLVVGIELQESQKRRWFTPQELTLRLLKIGAHVAPNEIQFVIGCLHGCIDLFGFTGTLKLALLMKRRSKQWPQKQKRKESAPSATQSTK